MALRENSPFRTLWTARALSCLGDSMGLVALLLYTGRTAGTALAVALLLLAGDCVPGLLGPLAGAIGDRFDRRRVMVVCEIVQGLAVGTIAFVLPDLPLLLALVTVRGLARQVFGSASRAAIPSLVDDADLARANAALGAGTYGLEAIGPLVAAALLPLLDVRGILLVDVLTFAVSAVLLARLPVIRTVRDRASTTSLLADVTAGLAYLSRTPVVRAIALGFVGVVACNGVDDVALLFLGKQTLGASDSAAAAVYAGVGIGLALGYPLLGRYGAGLPAVALALAGFAVNSAGNLLTGLAWAVPVALMLQVVRGIGISALDVGVNTHLQRHVPADVLSRVFGSLYGAVGIAAGLSYVFGGLLLAATSPRTTFVVAGTGGLLVTAVTAVAITTSTSSGSARRRRP